VAAGLGGAAGASILGGSGKDGISVGRPIGGYRTPALIKDTTGGSDGLPQYDFDDELKLSILKLIGKSSIIAYRYPRGVKSDIIGLKKGLRDNPSFVDSMKDILKDTPKNSSSDDILEIIKKDKKKQEAILEALKRLQLPDAPNFKLGGGSGQVPQPSPDDPSGDGTGTDVSNELKDKIINAGDKVSESGIGEVTKTLGQDDITKTGRTKTETDTSGKTRTKTEVDDDEDDDEDEPKPDPPKIEPKEKENGQITERPVDNLQRKAMSQETHWYPEYNFGGQNLLKLTDVEKLEELKSYTLFDLVTPLLIGDEDNLLALQNKIQENRRFTNTYANPKPERPLVPPKNIESWRQPMKSVYPTPYPMSLDQPQQQLYYDDWNNQNYQYQDKKLDSMAMGGNFDPDLQKILNSKRNSYTACDRRVIQHGPNAKESLLENIDSSSITALDLMLLR